MAIPFKELGLSQYEASTYESLIKFGKAPASKISADSGVPYSRIYDILAKLVNKGLAKVVPGITQEYVSADPKQLLELVEQKQHTLKQAEEEIKKLKVIYETKEKEAVIVAYGKKNFHKLAKEMLPPKKYQCAFRYVVDPKPEWIRSDKDKIKKGVDWRSLVRLDEDTQKNVDKYTKATNKKFFRECENEGIAMSIRDDNEILIGLIKSNTTMLIRDKPFVKLMKKLFDSQWKNSKQVT